MKITLSISLFALMLFLSVCAGAQQPKPRSLYEQISRILKASNAKVGVGMLGLDFSEKLLLNNDHHYPMQSVYKLPLAMAVLHQVDQGKLSLNQEIKIAQQSLDTATWSPLVKDFPDRDITLTLAELLRYTISKSDNNGCDALFRLMGGTHPVNSYIHGLGAKAIAIAATEAEMKQHWEVQYTNWCQPSAMLELLRQLFSNKTLSAGSRSLLMRLMTESENSPHRLKGELPEEVVVAHKTGTSNTNKKGLTAATNDVGILTLPNGKHVAIVVFVSNFRGGVSRGEQLIASISKAIWDHYQRK